MEIDSSRITLKETSNFKQSYAIKLFAMFEKDIVSLVNTFPFNTLY